MINSASKPSSNLFIDSLLDSSVYPHKVAEITLLETHISWIVLTGYYAYKIKKPVDFGFLDFSTLQKRHFYCEQELRLNQRFSDSLYIDVVKFTGSIDCPEINGEGPLIEYAVRMHEFPQQGLLNEYIKNPGLTEQHMEQLARQLAEFHQDACVPKATEMGTPVFGSFEAVSKPALENVQHIRPLLEDKDDRDLLLQLDAWLGRQLPLLADIIEQRRINGFVRECHGDLHLGNIVIIKGEIIFFDCIEFNEQLRWLDTMSELAYLLMDLENNKCWKLANRLLNKYMEYSGDFDGIKMLLFYKVYRAMVRAKVSILRLQQTDLSEVEKQELLSVYRHYMDLARGYVLKHIPFLAITHGLAASGKSTISADIAAECNGICIRSDVERKRIFGLGPLDRSSSSLHSGIYSPQATDKTFARLRLIAGLLLDNDYPVIVDACFLSKAQRDHFNSLAQEKAVNFMIIDCQADKETLKKRIIERNRQGNDASEAGLTVLEQQCRSQDMLTAEEQAMALVVDTEVDTEKPIDMTAFHKLIGRTS